MENTLLVTFGRYITVDEESVYCREFDTVEIKPTTPYLTREWIEAITDAAGLDDKENIFVERIDGEALGCPTGFKFD